MGNFHTTDKTKLFNFLKSHPVGVLATVDADGNPHASTIYFAVDDNLTITFTTHRDTRKAQNIEHHGKVMLATYDAAEQSAVQVFGKATKTTDPTAVQQAFLNTMRAAKHTGEDTVPPVAKILAGPYVAYTIEPENIWLSEYGWGDSFANAMKHKTTPEEKTADPA
jgi:general stress protein 26